MGYTTEFYGEFRLDRPLTIEQRDYLMAFAHSRRMKRDPDIAALLPDPLRLAVGLPVGLDGGYYVGGADRTQDHDASVLAYNDPPGEPEMPPPSDPGQAMADWSERYQKHEELIAAAHQLGLAQPGLWCQWVPNDNGTAIHWDGGEKFYNYVQWIEYLITHFLKPWGYVVNGVVEWQGEERDDVGQIHIKDNVVQRMRPQVSWIPS